MLARSHRTTSHSSDAISLIEVTVGEVGMFTPLGCAKFTLSNRTSQACLAALQSMLCESSSLAVVRKMLARHGEAYDPWGCVHIENVWQLLGVAVAGGGLFAMCEGTQLFASGCWSLASGYWLLVGGCWLLVADCSLLVVLQLAASS